VHLDVKPANVLVTSRESAGEHVYIADFGLTRRGATGHRTRGGDFLGSPTYAAPEHLRGEPVDGRTDAYSLACVLFACLTGRPPFHGQVPEVIRGHLNREPPKVTDFVALPGSIDEVIRRAMAKNPQARYATCRELMAAARQALSAVPDRRGLTGTRPVTVPVPGQAMGYGEPLLPVGTHSSSAEPVRLRPPVPASSTAFISERRGSRWLPPILVGLVAIGLIIAAILYFTGDSGGGVEPTQNPPVPSIKVGPGSGAQPTSEAPSNSTVRLFPSLPVRPSTSP
jgi:serine/threonine-protein kinase